ncbi:MAG: hypothetical protein LBN27_01765 [Prevotellaceae bacterium]|jgi:hypothetical protein|nr:hypothetical protein [Prevotellaceae bacterium]
MTIKELKEARERWKRHSELVQNSTFIREETMQEKYARIARLRRDYAAFVEYYFPHWCTDKETGAVIPCAKFHIQAANLIKDNRNLTAIFQWARGHAKSTHMNCFIPLWLKCQEKRNINVFVTVGASETSALSWANNVQMELQYNQRYINDFGIQVNAGSWEQGEFTTLDGFTVISRGRGQKPRGLNKRSFRPDYIVIDDLDDDELCLNGERVKKMTNWVKEALYNTFGAEGGRFIMVGNLISKESVMSNIAKMDGMLLSQVNIRDSKGNPSWAEYWTEERIKQREVIGYRSFQKEYMNNPITEGEVFREMTWGKVPPLHKFRFLVCYGDPSPSNNKTKANSMKAAFLIGAHEGKFYIIDGRVSRATNAEFVDWFYDLNQTVPDGVQVYNMIENNTLQDPFYRQVFIPMFMEKGRQGQPINIAPDERKKPDKFSRIEGNLEPLNTQGRLILNIDKKDNPHFKRLEEQFLLLTPQLRAPADGADCIEGGVWWLQRKTQTIADGSMSLSGKKHNSNRI